ncbi:MAG: amidase [Acidobacteria bacterium]|nr:MAG: amidase [Acidobacteriota bacterium]
MSGAETLVSVRDRLERRELSSEELVRAQIDRAEKIDALNAFITLLPERAIEAARRSDEERARGELRGPLHGIPITVKDLVHSRGVRTTSGSKIFADLVPEADAPCLRSLLDAGAVLMGKTNLHELAYGVTNVNPHYGAARNPWDTERVSGGSSGGSAASLAAGVGFGSIGTDTGGSIRIPSSLCGTVGLKPTYGQVSREGVTPLSWSLDHVGPMARTVDDVALLYEVLTGVAASSDAPGPLALGIHERYFFDNLAPDVEASVRTAITELERLGMKLVEVDIPEIELQTTCRNTIAFSEASSFHEDNVLARPEDYGADTLELLRLGLLIPATDYLAATRARRPIVRAFRKAFQKIDMLVTPATVAAAPRIGDKTLDNGEELRSGLLRLASPFNTTGFPAVSLPCGFTEDGRPIGLQLAAAPNDEKRLLELARAYEQSQDWSRRAPVI